MRSQLLTSSDWYLLHDISKPLATEINKLNDWFLQQAQQDRTTVVQLYPQTLSVIRTALDYATESETLDPDMLLSCFQLERKLRRCRPD